MLRKMFGVLRLGLICSLAGCSAHSASESGAALQPTQAHAELMVERSSSFGPYLLRPNDQLRIRVFNESEVSGDYQIDSDGFVSIPLAGRVKASGLTAGQLERAITSRLTSGVLKQPRVNVDIATYAPFYIHGEVKRAGGYPFKPGLTVMDAVASAGGFTYRANEGKIYILRTGSNVEEVHSTNTAVPVYPGDNVRVPERYF